VILLGLLRSRVEVTEQASLNPAYAQAKVGCHALVMTCTSG